MILYVCALPRDFARDFAHDFARDPATSTIKVNQLGFLPAGRKMAYVGNWLGDPGAGWDVCGTADATRDHTLVRSRPVWPSAGSALSA